VVLRLLALLRGFPASGRPSKRWLSQAEEMLPRLADARHLGRAAIDAILDANDAEVVRKTRHGTYRRREFLAGDNEFLLCALIAFVGLQGSGTPLDELRRLAAKVVTGPYGWPRSLRVANACVRAIAQAQPDDAVPELVALDRSTTHGTLRREIATAIQGIADQLGIDKSELLEAAVETHGLDANATRSVEVTDGAALLAVKGLTAHVYFVDAAGRRRKSFPAATRTASADEIAELRDAAKLIRKTLSAERSRLDALLSQARSWSLADWRRLYLAHPITVELSRRLI
jgi:hypothetical protein